MVDGVAGPDDRGEAAGADGAARSPGAAAAGASRLAARELTLAYDDRTVVRDLHLAIPDGRITVIVGPNACGKSTTLRALGRLLKPRSGTVLLDGEELAGVPTRRIAQSIGLLPQSPTAPEAITVADLVSRGRQPHQRWWQQWSEEDERAVTAAMERTDVTELADRSVDELSGGQRQRVWIAMALAQETDLLLLDEPTTFLDIAHQVEVLDLVRRLNHERGRTVVIVLHDLNQAARYADHLVAMKEGAVVAEGRPGDVVTADLVREVFGLEAVVIPDPVTGSPLVVPGSPYAPPATGAAGDASVPGDTTGTADTTGPAGTADTTGSRTASR
ncbi:ABC transporter ATP-binding protein [Streptomyces fuscigenes]|uniref:ABC transporter ATP-binding protein n=1 Tax=Streptomyces fuscigenes TaxID=1528880 RepID=UPI001F33003A|nr:ABC transporter ATP-binding protein [Streptomyces fuscigenes]MCF3963881.1 ABC transporter ATP-binding protein [Streptomyces fuscigenes]